MEEKTENLNNELNNKHIDDYINNHSFDDFDSLNFSLSLKELINSKNIKISEVIKNSNLSKSYVYSILNGDRQASRDKIINLALCLKANLDECNSLLKSACFRHLHPKSKRDSIIIYCLNNKYSLANTNIELEKNNEIILK